MVTALVFDEHAVELPTDSLGLRPSMVTRSLPILLSFHANIATGAASSHLSGYTS